MHAALTIRCRSALREWADIRSQHKIAPEAGAARDTGAAHHGFLQGSPGAVLLRPYVHTPDILSNFSPSPPGKRVHSTAGAPSPVILERTLHGPRVRAARSTSETQSGRGSSRIHGLRPLPLGAGPPGMALRSARGVSRAARGKPQPPPEGRWKKSPAFCKLCTEKPSM